MKIIYLIPTAFSLAFSLFSCSPDEEKKPAKEFPPMPVQVMTPQEKNLILTRSYTGRFIPIEQADIRARVSGFITDVLFKEGQFVKKGDVLVKIDPALYEAAQSAMNARLAQAEVALSLAQKNAVRAEKLLETNSISQQDADSRMSNLAGAKADRDLALAQLEEASLNLSYTTVKAPISGVIGKRVITTGNYISGGTSVAPVLASIIPQSPLYFEFEVDERQAQDLKLKPKHPVNIAVSDADDYSTEGEVVFQNNELNSSSATLTLRALVPNQDGAMKPGAFGRVQLPISEKATHLTVPETALSFEQTRRYLWVIGEGNIPQKTYVTVGDLIGGDRIVTDGLKGDEKIAISGIQMIRPGMPVAPMPAQEK